MNKPGATPEVEIIHRRNRLKEKVVEEGQMLSGQGFIDPEAIRRAQAIINNGQDKFIVELKRALEELIKTWTELKTEKVHDQDKINDIHRLANHIKDMAGTFGNRLMDDFGESLRDFSDQIDLSRKEHVIIVQAHIDVMWIAFTKDIQDIDTQEAVQLKTMLSQAIEKYAPSGQVGQ